MPVSVEIYDPSIADWKYQALVTKTDGHKTFEAFSGKDRFFYVIRPEGRNSKAVINRVAPRAVLTGPVTNALLYEDGDCETRAVLRKGESHIELVKASEHGLRTLVRFTQL